MTKKAKKKTAKKQRATRRKPARKAASKGRKSTKTSTSKSGSAGKRMKPGKKMKPEDLMTRVQGRVEGYLKKLFKSHYEKTDDGRFLVYHGSTIVQTVLRPWHADDVMVESFAYVVQDSNLSPELLKFLLRENAVIHFGSFGLGFDGTIIFSHSLAGANLDENEFNASIRSVAKIADYYDNKIVEMAGGMTAREAMKKGVF